MVFRSSCILVNLDHTFPFDEFDRDAGLWPVLSLKIPFFRPVTSQSSGKLARVLPARHRSGGHASQGIPSHAVASQPLPQRHGLVAS